MFQNMLGKFEDERFIIIASFFISIIGLILIYVASEFYSPEKVNPWEIEESMIGKYISTEGKVKKVWIKEDNLFFMLENSSILFVDFNYKIRPDVGDFVELEGRVSRYKGNLEVLVDKLNVKG